MPPTIEPLRRGLCDGGALEALGMPATVEPLRTMLCAAGARFEAKPAAIGDSSALAIDILRGRTDMRSALVFAANCGRARASASERV